MFGKRVETLCVLSCFTAKLSASCTISLELVNVFQLEVILSLNTQKWSNDAFVS